MDKLNLGPWPAGMNNVAPDHALPVSKYGRIVAARNAVNVDFDDSGRARRRKGFTQALLTPGAHSLWTREERDALFVADNLLYSFNGSAARPLGVVNCGAHPLSYAEVNGKTYFTCPTARGVLESDVIQPWGVEVPAVPPMLLESAGTLAAGDYFVAMTYVLKDGRESGASPLAKFTLGAPGGFAVISMPNPTSVDVVAKRLYISTTDGDVLYRAGEFSAAAQFATADSPPSGSQLLFAHMSAPPLGSALAHYNGRIFIVDGNTVWYTEAHDYDHVDVRKNFYRFSSRASVIAAVEDGLYVCADKTYFIPNAGSTNAEQMRVLDFGAFPNTAHRIPKSKDVIWMSERGPVVATAGGSVEVLAADGLAPGKMEGAASLIREEDGLRQFITVGTAIEGASVQANSYAEAEVIRKADR